MNHPKPFLTLKQIRKLKRGDPKLWAGVKVLLREGSKT